MADPAGVSGTVGSYVFVRGGDGALYVGRVVGGVWQGWQPLGGYLTSFPATVVDSSGLWVAVRGGDGALHARHLARDRVVGWQNFGGYLDSPPSLAADASRRLCVRRGRGWRLVRQKHPRWGELAEPRRLRHGGARRSRRRCRHLRVRAGRRRRHVLAARERWAAWTPLQYLGWYSTSTPLGVADTIGVSVYVRGSDGALYRRHFDGASWTDWSRLGGYLASDPIPVSDGVGFEHVFVVGGDPQLYTISVLGTASLAPFASASAEDARPRTTPLPLSIKIHCWASLRIPARHADKSRCPPSRVDPPIQARRMWPGRSSAARSIVSRSAADRHAVHDDVVDALGRVGHEPLTVGRDIAATADRTGRQALPVEDDDVGRRADLEVAAADAEHVGELAGELAHALLDAA